MIKADEAKRIQGVRFGLHMHEFRLPVDLVSRLRELVESVNK